MASPTRARARKSTTTPTVPSATKEGATPKPGPRPAPAATPAATPAPTPAPEANGSAERNPAKVAAGFKARATYAESSVSGVTQVCANRDACGDTKPQPIFHFPTTSRRKDGSLGRGKECRKCRDARRAADKES